MDEDVRQLPQVHPGLGLNQRGNFISVRQKPDQDGGWGTLRQPKRFTLPLMTPHRLRSRLGFEAVPSSEFWQFTVSGRVRLQVNRLSEDRYANSVGVALLDASNRRVAPLVQSASGRGTAVEIGPGTFKVVASLGIAENIKDLVLEFLAEPVGGAMHGTATATGMVIGTLLEDSDQERWLTHAHRSLLRSTGTAEVGAVGMLRSHQPDQVVAIATAAVGAVGQVNAVRGTLHATAVGLINGYGTLVNVHPTPLHGIGGAGNVQGVGALATVRWLDEPYNNWRARLNAGVVELNRPYVHFNVDPLSLQRLLGWLRELLPGVDGGDFHIPESDAGVAIDLDGGDFDTGWSEAQADEDWIDGGLFP